MIKAVLFDLDGTLLPMDEKAFLKIYIGKMVEKFHGELDSEKLPQGILAGLEAMMKNNGEVTNEEIFWKVFESILPITYEDFEHRFIDYYENEFDAAKDACIYNPTSKKIVDLCNSKGIKCVLATNPVFPKIATQKRCAWSGCDWNDFIEVSTYENYSACKPNTKYFEELFKKTGLKAEEVIMVGNDVNDDGSCMKLGIPFYLVTDTVIGNHDDIDCAFKGTMEQLYTKFKEIL